jgi:hypothetical protein
MWQYCMAAVVVVVHGGGGGGGGGGARAGACVPDAEPNHFIARHCTAGTVRIDYTADLSLKSWRRPLIALIGSALNTLGADAMKGIVNFYEHGDKNGPTKGDAATGAADADTRHS